MRYLVIILITLTGPVEADDGVSFRQDIAPIFIDHCLSCHAADRAEGGYRVDHYQALLEAGDSGTEGIFPHAVDDSEVFQRVKTDDLDMRMPLEGQPLSKEEITLLRRWIEQGARYDAKDPVAPLTTILPITQHPPPPAAYPDWWPIGSVAWEPREGRIYVGGYREITVWDGGGRLARRISNLPERISAMEFAPDHARLAVAGGQPGRLGDVRIVDVMAGEVTDVVLQTPGVVLDVAWNPAGDRLAVAAADRSVRVYRFEVDTGRWHLELEDQSHSDWVYSVTWDRAGKRLATASRDGSTKVIDAETGKSIVSYQGHTGPVRTALFAADGDHVFSATADQLHRWKIEDGQQAGKPIPLEGEILALTHFDGHMMVTTDAEKVFQLDGTSGEKKNESTTLGQRPVCVAAADQAGRCLLGTFGGQVMVWDWDAQCVVANWDAYPKTISKLAPEL